MNISSALGFGMLTIGSTNHNLTLASGFGLYSGETIAIPAVAISGTTRLNNFLALTSENFIIPNQSSLINYIGIHAIRIITRKNAFDLGLFTIGSGELLSKPFFTPVLGYTRTFEL